MVRMTKKNIVALKVLHAWALRVKEQVEGQSEEERRMDVATSEEGLPDGSDLTSEY